MIFMISSSRNGVCKVVRSESAMAKGEMMQGGYLKKDGTPKRGGYLKKDGTPKRGGYLKKDGTPKRRG